MKTKAYFITDKKKNTKKIKAFLEKKIQSTTINKASIFIVLGGDGFMLQSLKKYHALKKAFYGINLGNYGFLMNKFSKKNFLKNLVSSTQVTINPLKATIKNNRNQKKRCYAINEISIFRQSKQTASISIKKGKNFLIQKLVADGVLVSTPAGSTAYNLSVHGPILNLESKKLAITPISPFRPRRWKGQITSEKTKIIIQNLDISKRPISAVADNIEFRNVKEIIISIEKKIKFNLLFNKNNSLQKKIKLEQLRKDINTSFKT